MNTEEIKEEEQPTSLAEVKKVYGEKWTDFFNNFFEWFPALVEGGISDRRGMMKKFGYLDKPFREFYSPEESKLFSAKFLDTTPKQFFEEIDKLAIENGIQGEEVKRLKQLSYGAGLNIQYLKELDELIAPVFFGLRKMGYGHLELVM